jgi:multidrug efflux pump subunit AcrA (membrane-fusion protein)
MDELYERIRRAEEELATQATWDDGEPARVRRRIRASIAGAVLLTILAFVALLPVGAALGMVVRALARLLNG